MSLSTVAKQTKYGLINVKDKPKPKAPVRKLMPSAFKDDDDEGEDDDDGEFKDPRADIKRANAELIKKSEVTAKKLEEISKKDADIYLYDEVYEETHQKKENGKEISSKEKQNEKPKYLQNIMAAAKIREIENDRAYERKILKEREKEEKENEAVGSAPKFITSAYKQKLLEEKKWEYEDKIMDEVEKKTDVRGLGMQGFYAGLLTKNIAMGNDVEKNAISAYTSGSSRQQKLVETPHTTQQQEQQQQHADRSGMSSDDFNAKRQKTDIIEDSTNVNTKGDFERANVESVLVKNIDTPQVDTTSKVLSARERFLLRKRNAEEMASSTSS